MNAPFAQQKQENKQKKTDRSHHKVTHMANDAAYQTATNIAKSGRAMCMHDTAQGTQSY
jgi:tRNA1(Val) A37 N6-methylase TrmN6